MGFKWNDVHTNDLKILAHLRVKPIVPEPKLITEDMMTADGIIDFSEYNDSGRAHYKNRLFEYDCVFQRSSLKDMAAQANALAAIFMRRTGYLIDDDIPNVRWNASIVNRIDLSRIGICIDKFSITFQAAPFSEALAITEETFYVSGSDTIIIDNAGTWYSNPVIRLEGSIGNIDMHMNEKTFSFYNTSKNNIVIDSDKATVMQGSENLAQYAEGDFLELKPGANILNINGFTGDLMINFLPKYIWN